MEYLVECSTVQKSLVMGPVHLKEQTYAVLFMPSRTRYSIVETQNKSVSAIPPMPPAYVVPRCY